MKSLGDIDAMQRIEASRRLAKGGTLILLFDNSPASLAQLVDYRSIADQGLTVPVYDYVGPGDRDILTNLRYDYSLGSDSVLLGSKELARHLGVSAFPATVLVNQAGKIIKIRPGVQGTYELRDLVRSADSNSNVP